MARFWKSIELLTLVAVIFSLIPTSTVFAYVLLGLKWRTNQTGLDYNHLPTKWRNVVYYSRTAWNNAGSKMNIYYSSISQNDVAVGYYDTGWTGLTQYRRYWLDGWYFTEADVYLNTKYVDPTYEARLPASNRIDGQSTTTHELGHLVGLAHSYYPTTMYAYAEYGTTWKRSLHSDDIAGIRALYP